MSETPLFAIPEHKQICPLCQHELVMKSGKHGPFLGCSHYPYLIPQIRKIIPSHIEIIDSGEAVAKQTKNILEKFNLINYSKEIGQQIFYTNSEPEVLKNILQQNQEVIFKNF